VRVGILRFGVLFAAGLIVFAWLTTQLTPWRFLEYAGYIVIVSAIGGTVFGAVGWFYCYRVAIPFLRWLLPRLRR
jgi:hypothetical protein